MIQGKILHSEIIDKSDLERETQTARSIEVVEYLSLSKIDAILRLLKNNKHLIILIVSGFLTILIPVIWDKSSISFILSITSMFVFKASNDIRKEVLLSFRPYIYAWGLCIATLSGGIYLGYIFGISFTVFFMIIAILAILKYLKSDISEILFSALIPFSAIMMVIHFVLCIF